MPKRPGQAVREALAEQQKRQMQEYFEGLKIEDVDFEVVDTKILGLYEEQRIGKKFIYNKTWRIYEK